MVISAPFWRTVSFGTVTSWFSPNSVEVRMDPENEASSYSFSTALNSTSFVTVYCPFASSSGVTM